jgi:hypothetical protein
MFHRIVALMISMSLLALVAPNALAAGNVTHYRLVESEQSSMPLDDELAACVGYNGVANEDRIYDIRVAEFTGEPQAGRVRLTGFVYGEFTIEPNDPDAGLVYRGSYREKITFIGSSFDDPLVFSFVLPVTATGADGSRVKLLMHGHGVIRPDGDPRVMVLKFNCIQSGG